MAEIFAEELLKDVCRAVAGVRDDGNCSAREASSAVEAVLAYVGSRKRLEWKIEADVREYIHAHAQDKSARQMARELGVSNSTVSRILKELTPCQK